MKPYYKDALATIYCGDAYSVLSELDVGAFDLVLTDPPYSSGARRDAERQVRGAMLREMDDEDWFSHDSMTNWGFSWFLRSLFVESRRVLPKGAHVYIFTDWRQTPNVYGILEATGFRVNHCLVWAKPSYGMGAYWRNQHENIVFGSVGQPAKMANRGMGSVLQAKAVHSSKRVHPTEKPIDLLASIIQAVSGDVVCDPFMGSGTTLRAAKTLGRKSIGVDINEKYCELAARQLERELVFT